MEVLIAATIFTILTLSIFFTYRNILEIVGRSEHTTLATTLLNREIELIRNLNFDDVGIEGGYPPGVIPQVITRNFQGVDFQIHAFVRNIDHHFDGTVTTTPKDTAPADYRLVELRAECDDCVNYKPISVTTLVAAAALEAASSNGSIFIDVFDANGQPVSFADVTVINTIASPTINIVDTTDVSGSLQLVDVPTSTEGYEILVSKSGYSTSGTYSSSTENPNPSPPHATVASQELTSISFAIDVLSRVQTRALDPFCSPVENIHFNIDGSKIIGTDPNVLKFSTTSLSTDSNGALDDLLLEWDTYTFTNASSTNYDILGSTPINPLILNPDLIVNFDFVFVPASTRSLLVTVLDAASSTPITDATVSVGQSGTTTTKPVGYWQAENTDWSAGSPADYSSQSGSIEDSTAGELTLVDQGGGTYTTTTQTLTSNSFDLGTSTTEFRELSILPGSLPPNTDVNLQIE
ncbi:MAG: hypothetical protein OXT67_04070, partial [Zetaproteobacteria bacterium]|nr:hypothetical protein [Zetaproteobacteria bacterium]